jgi:hypothetical protein
MPVTIDNQCLQLKVEIHLTTKWYQRIIRPQRALPLAASAGVIYLLQDVTTMVSAISARDNFNFMGFKRRDKGYSACLMIKKCKKNPHINICGLKFMNNNRPIIYI